MTVVASEIEAALHDIFYQYETSLVIVLDSKQGC